MAGYTISYYTPEPMGYTLNDNITRFLNRGGMRGFGFPQGDVSTQRAPYTHGTALMSTTPYAAPREMQLSLTLKVADGGTYSDLRNAYESLCRIVSPWQGTTGTDIYRGTTPLGQLWIVRPDASIRRIYCWCTNVSDLEEDGIYAGTVDLTFLAPYPFFFGTADDSVNEWILGTAATGLTWPVTFPITFTSGDVDSDAPVNNSGDVEVWPTVYIYGPGDNPVVENDTTGKSWSCAQTMDTNDYITVNMQLGTVTFWDNSAGTTTTITDTMGTTTEFWPLIRGENTVHVELENVASMTAMVYFYPHYMAI